MKEMNRMTFFNINKIIKKELTL